MLQDLVTAAVNEALEASRRSPSRRWARCSRSAASAACSAADRRRVANLLIEPVAKLIEAFNRLPGIGPRRPSG
jgi:hypothetical protein